MALRKSFSLGWNKNKNKNIKKLEKKIALPIKDPFSDIAVKMIEKELQLEKNIDAIIIHELIALYSEAVEYYSTKNDSKYADYQIRMQNMLKKPEILKALKIENGSTQISKRKNIKEPQAEPLEKNEKIEKPQEREEISIIVIPENQEIEKPQEKEEISIIVIAENLEIQTPVETILIEKNEVTLITSEKLSPVENFLKESPKEFTSAPISSLSPLSPISPISPINPITSLSPIKSMTPISPLMRSFTISPTKPKNFNIIIDRHSSNNKVTASRAKADFKSQETALERRLASRKKIQHTRSMSFIYTPNDISQDFGEDLDESLPSEKFDCFVVDELAEDLCEKYEKKLEEIMEKNFGERALKIAEIKLKYETQINEISGMGGMMQMLVQQMKSNMQEEIEKIIEEYDAQRKELISKLKEYN